MRKTETLLGKYCDPVSHAEFLVVEVQSTTSIASGNNGERRYVTRSSYQTFDGKPLELAGSIHKTRFKMGNSNQILEKVTLSH